MNRIIALNILLGFCCFIVLAKLTADLVSHRLNHFFPQTVKKVAPSQVPVASEDLNSFAPILEKGLFGPATVGKLTPIVATTAAKGPAPTTAQNDLVLLGTAVGSYHETFALIQKTSSKEERVFRLGDRVYDLGPLVAVMKDEADIQAGGEKIKLLTPTAAGSESKPAAAQAAPQPGALATPVGSGSYVIDQRALNAALDNIGQAMTDARLLPSMKEGKVEGFRVSEVKPAGIFGMVGIKNGDVLLRINDFAIDSPDKAIQSFVSLKGQSRIKLDLIRDGQPTTLNYDIR